MANTEWRQSGQSEGLGEALVVRDEKGNYYYLRPEVLQACKVPKEEVEAVKHAPPPAENPRAEVVASLNAQTSLREIDPELAERLSAATDTHMCPW